MSSYSYRVYQDGDEEQIVPLLQTVFDGWPHLDIDSTPLKFWRWKYQNKPGEEKLVLVSTLNDRIVGVIHAVPINVKVKDRILSGILGGDMAVHPDHRGFGLSKALNELIRNMRINQGRYLSYLATRNPRMITYHSKSSNRFTHTITNMVRIRDVDKHLQAMPMDNSTIMKIGYSALKLKNEAMKLLEPRNPKRNLRIIRAHEFDDRADRLYAEASKGFDFIVVRNKDYMNWKYCSKEVGKYEVYQALDDEDDLLGYIILRINRFNPSYPIGYIVDILTHPDHMSISDHLIKEGVRYFDENNINICLSASPVGNPYKRYLTRNDFLDSRIKFILFYRYDGGENQRVVNDIDTASRVHFSFGDLDALPIKIDSYE